ncbi:unnamed protein product [Closterium sp. NIES-53]
MTRLDAGTIAEASKLRLIVQFGVGLEGVDVTAATARGIRVGRIPSADTGNAVSCAEHAIYLALALLRKQRRMQESIQQQRLGQPIGQTIFGKSALIVGYGGIGKALAARLRAFGVTWLGGVRRGWAGVHGRRGEGEEEAGVWMGGWCLGAGSERCGMVLYGMICGCRSGWGECRRDGQVCVGGEDTGEDKPGGGWVGGWCGG